MRKGNYLAYHMVCESRLYSQEELDAGIELGPLHAFFEQRFQRFFNGINIPVGHTPVLDVSMCALRQSRTDYRIVYRANVTVPMTKGIRTRVNAH